MNSGTRIRTALRIAFSIYSAFCVWQVSISELGKSLGVEWMAIACAIIIVLSGIAVDILTTYLNNDYTVEADTHTKLMRQAKELRDYVPMTVDEPEDSEVDDGEE